MSAPSSVSNTEADVFADGAADGAPAGNEETMVRVNGLKQYIRQYYTELLSYLYVRHRRFEALEEKIEKGEYADAEAKQMREEYRKCVRRQRGLQGAGGGDSGTYV